MGVILLLLLVVFGIVGWWLSHQRLFSKPWLESGPNSIVEGTDRIGLPKAKLGLVVFLAVIGSLFALFTSGYVIRMDLADWRSLPLPSILWVNTGLLILSSVSLQYALVAARKGTGGTPKILLVYAGIAAIGFLVGQVVAWRQLVEAGYVLVANPANSFFYLITGLHGLHIIGGLVALGRTTVAAWDDAPGDQLRHRIDLCALYWHFLLFVWFALLLVLTGGLRNVFEFSRQLLS